MPKAKGQEAQLTQARLAMQAGQLQDARRTLYALLRQDPHNAAGWVLLGQTEDDPDRRKECLTRALRLDPDNQEARRGLVALLSGPQPETPGEAEGKDRPTHISAYPSPCRQCGAHLRYDIPSRALRCAHCGTEHPLPSPSLPTWPGLPPDYSSAELQAEPIGRDMLRCRSCGAVTELSRRTASLACPFCGSPQVVREKGGVRLIPPQAIIPFQLDEQAAVQALQEWLGAGFLHPGDLAEKAELLRIHGSYQPIWGFKGLAKVSYRLNSGGYRGTLPMVPSVQEQHIAVDDILLPASYSLDEDMLRRIEPIDLGEAVAFRPEYLAGWPAEVYQVALADATLRARERMSAQGRQKAQALAPVLADPIDTFDLGASNWGKSGRRQQQEITYRVEFCTMQLDSYIHLMLPVWQGAYRYRGRTYAFAVNGQTGQVGGQAPRSAAAVALVAGYAVVGLVLIAGLLVLLWPSIRGLGEQLQTEGAANETLLFALGIVAVVFSSLVGLGWLAWQRIKKKLFS